MNKEPLIIVPLFEEHIPVRDAVVHANMCMLRKAYTLAYRKRHRITIGVIPATPNTVAFMCDVGMYAYMALSRLKKDTPESLEIIQMLSMMYKEFTTGEKATYHRTDMMYKLALEDASFGLRRSILLQKGFPTGIMLGDPKPKLAPLDDGRNMGDIFLTATKHLPDALKVALNDVLAKWNTGNNYVYDQTDMDLIPSATSVIVDWQGEGVFRVTLHAVCHEISETAMRYIRARLLGKEERGCNYHIEGKGQMFVEIDSLKNKHNASETVINLVKTGIQNNVVHSILDICAKRYECEIVLKPRKK